MHKDERFHSSPEISFSLNTGKKKSGIFSTKICTLLKENPNGGMKWNTDIDDYSRNGNVKLPLFIWTVSFAILYYVYYAHAAHSLVF